MELICCERENAPHIIFAKICIHLQYVQHHTIYTLLFSIKVY